MKLNFTKMHGAGNDFVIIDLVRQKADLSPGRIRHIADRHKGIGCDQVLVVAPPDDGDADFRYRIFNADGTEAGQCGNGARCFARFVREQRLTWKRELVLQTQGGEMMVKFLDDGRIMANLGPPKFAPEEVPISVETTALEYTLSACGQDVVGGAVSMGNPHLVLQVEDTRNAPVETLGPALESHPLFPDRVNVGFMQVLSPREIRLRVFERGAGETLACGSGACAAVVHGIRSDLLEDTVTVHLPGGKLSVSWAGDTAPVWLGGPTATVYEGVIRFRK